MDYSGIHKESLDTKTDKLSEYEYSTWFYDLILQHQHLRKQRGTQDQLLH